MASPHKQHDLLVRGIVSNKLSREGFAKNVFFRNGRLEVRQGLGQVAQFDTSLSHNFESSIPGQQLLIKWGYRKHLGSHVLYTTFGHVQIVSVFLARAITTNETRLGMSANVCIVSIYDVTTGDRWEEPLYQHSGENNRNSIPMPQWRMQYETCVDRDQQAWVQVEGTDSFYFTEFRNILFFGSRETGLLVYYPTIFNGNRIKQADKVRELDWALPYGETSIISRAVPSAGAFVEGVTYFTRSEFPNPTVVTSANNRMIYAAGQTLFFSEPGQPTNIRADNFITLSDASGDITAIASQFGNIHIFTENECWTYHPNEGGDNVASGRLNPMSRSVGCSGKNAICYRRDKVVWVDRNGVYATTGNYVVETLSLAIDDFFQERGIADPTTGYYLQGGHTYLEDQPRSFFYYKPDRVHLSYWHDQNLLFFDVPGQNCSLVLCDNNEWCLWTYESRVQVPSGEERVQSIANIDELWQLPIFGSLYSVGTDIDSQTFVDATSSTSTIRQQGNTLSSSYFVLEYGRGGALDRNVYREDDRVIAGKYDRVVPIRTAQGILYIDKPIPMADKERLPANAEVTDTELKQQFLVPIGIVPRVGLPTGGPTSLEIEIEFDNTKWRPFLSSGSEVRYVVPAERLGSVDGYRPGAPIPTAQVRVFSGASPDDTGNLLKIYWLAGLATLTANMNLIPNQYNVLMYIPMYAIGDQVSSDVASMGWNVTVATANAAAYTMVACVWEQYFLGLASRNNAGRTGARTQPVDWCFKTPNLDPEDDPEITAHGIDMRVESHGHGRDSDPDVDAGWTEGILNVIVDSDNKMTQAQQIDYTGDDGSTSPVQRAHIDLQTVEDRHATNQTPAMVPGTFEDPNIEWLNEAAFGKIGDVRYLIADDPVYDLSVSTNRRGKRVSFMLYGYMVNRAQRLIFEKIKGKFSARPAGNTVRHSLGGGGDRS